MSSQIETYNGRVREMNTKLTQIRRSGAIFDQSVKRISDMIEKFEVEKAAANESKTKNMEEKARVENFISQKDVKQTDMKKRDNKKKEEIVKFQNAAKDSLNRITFKDLPKVKKEEAVERLFRFFYTNLYHEQAETFEFNKFIKVALKEEKIVFQKKLANFSLVRCTPEEREEIKAIKAMNFSTNEENEDLAVMLEWLDYTYEIYLLLKERDDLQLKMANVPAVESKYNFKLEACNKLIDECETNIFTFDNYIGQLKILRSKFLKAKESFDQLPQHEDLVHSVENVFSLIENYDQNPQLASILRKTQ